MNGIGHALSRIPAARALIAGAAFLAGASAPAFAGDVFDDVAMAVPRISPHGDSISLPQPLAPSDAARVRQVFRDHRAGNLAAAIPQTEQVTNPLLLGHILADRYLNPAVAGDTPPTEEQLRGWLTRYADLPDAPAMHAALAAVAPKGAVLPPVVPARAMAPAVPPADDVDAVQRVLPRNPVLDRSVHEPARAGRADQAVRLIARTRGIDPLYGALLRAEVAQILFSQGRDTEALALADAAHHQAKGRIGLAPFIAGLAAWRLERTELSQSLFEAAYSAGLSTAGRRSAAAFWAARAALRGRNPRDYAPWMQRAAESPRTFYGLLARRALGQSILTPEPTASWTIGEADIDAVASLPGGVRAFALLQVAQPARAEAELRRLWAETQDQPGFGRSIMLVARKAGLQAFARDVSSAMLPADALAMRLPATRLRPRGGFRVDPALVYAMARLESNFDADAVSRAGARGLMQLMPMTAGFVMRQSGSPAGTPRLHDPATNLDVAQRYLVQMSRYDAVQSDLIRLLASYNSGPGNVARWGAELRHMGDPLLFIESVPNDETRAYVPRVLTYTWLYAAQLRLPSPSLDELAAGTWPRFYAAGGSGVPGWMTGGKTELLARLH